MDLTPPQLLACCPRCPPAKAEEYLPHLNAAMREFGISEANQCDGCRAGLPVDHRGDHRAPYPSGPMACCRSRYEHPARVAAWLAQIGHESGDLRWIEELPHRKPVDKCRGCKLHDWNRRPEGHVAGIQYEKRRDLGNKFEGDGVRFRGRGVIQLTGRANYADASRALFPTAAACSACRIVGAGFDGRPPQACPKCAAVMSVLEAEPDRAASPDVAFRIAGWFWATREARHGGPMTADSLNVYADLAAEALVDGDARAARDFFDAITRAINGGTNGADDRWRLYLRCCEALGVTASIEAAT